MTKKDVLDALSPWLQATNAFAECERGLDKEPVQRTAAALGQALKAYAPVGGVTRDRTRRIVQNLAIVTGAFVSDQYSDDDTDAPSDVEWDVHNLIHSIDPSYVIPEEVEPAHVVGTVFPHPSDEE